MCISSDPVLLAVARRRNSSVRRRSGISDTGDLHACRASLQPKDGSLYNGKRASIYENRPLTPLKEDEEHNRTMSPVTEYEEE